MKKFNYTGFKLVLAFTILISVVFLFYYSCHPFFNFSKGSYILKEEIINAVYLNTVDLFGVEITSDTSLREFNFIELEDGGINITIESSYFYEYKNGMISINNQVEYYLYGENLLYKDSNHSLLEKIF